MWTLVFGSVFLKAESLGIWEKKKTYSLLPEMTVTCWVGCSIHWSCLTLATDAHIFRSLMFLFKARISFSLSSYEKEVWEWGEQRLPEVWEDGCAMVWPFKWHSHGCWTFGLMKPKAGTQGPRYLASTLSLSHTQVQCLPILGLFMLVSSSISLSFYIFDLGKTVSRMRVREWDLSQHMVDPYAFPSLMPKTRGKK